ncbi:MAG: hypothetical protein WBP61_00080 [Nocardioides sp.]
MQVAPVRLNTGVAASFAIGASLFALGSIPPYINAVGASADAATYAVGSIFFTLAAFGQLVQAQDPSLVDVTAETQHRPVPVPRWRYRPHDRGWAAAASQFPGTVFFNVSTFLALVHNATAAQTDQHVWRPDVYGSVLFLVASTFGILAVGRVRDLRPRSGAWWAAWLNMVGSIAFMASAIGSYVIPSTDELLDAPVAVYGTLLGAVCFLLGALLLPLAWRQDLRARLVPTPGT